MMTIAESANRPTGARPHVRSKFSFRNRGLLGAMLLVPVAAASLFSQPALDRDSSIALLLTASGWMFFLLYAAVRLWATFYIGGHKDRELQTDGPYSICRNPLYFGSFCFALSIACFLQSLAFGGALLVAAFIYFFWVVRAEEYFLGVHFQEAFRDYCRRTPRFWPRWSAFHTVPKVDVDLKWVRKEFIRLGRGAVCIILLQTVTHLRDTPQWPHWFNVW